jgi:hypothetical protein
MPYLPVDLTMQTEFPLEYGKDVQQGIEIIDEKWARHFPEVSYFCLLKQTTVVVDDNVDNASGEAGNSAFDPLWGESIDPQALIDGWKQPHLNPDQEAANVTQFADPVKLHAQVRREARDDELKKLGFDRFRDLLVTIPLSLLDKKGVTTQQGDRFIWDNELYQVEQMNRTGFWKNTNLRIYMVLNCEHARLGS